MKRIARRKFLEQLSIASAVLPFINLPFNVGSIFLDNDDLKINIFSKHLQFLDIESAGGIAAELGFSGVDLTVRPKGHVLPESVGTDLPKAIRDIQKGGSQCHMITTSIESVKNAVDREIIITAAQLGIKHYRTHWFKYKEDIPMTRSLEFYQEEIKELGDFNKMHNIVGCYQNHAGTSIGSSFWETKKLLETVDQNYFGAQYDIRHAIAEGGHSWVNGLRLLQKEIKVITLKDFKWGKQGDEWKVINVPIGDGMVDFLKYFKLLKKYQINVPVSMHFEYPLGGAEKGYTEISVDKKVVFDAMSKDLKVIRKLWSEA